jgi:two-component system, chemotaxis family, chemotaxis protein CheY
VDAHGGQIGAESDVGRGAKVWFTLPTARASTSVEPSPPKAAVTPPTAPILIVDDDREIREAISDILASRGYCAETAANGDEGLRYLRSGARRPCLILLDLEMPVMDGVTMHAHLRDEASLRTLPVVLMSNDSNVDRRASSMGASGGVRKPIDVAKLLAAIECHCTTD